MCKLEQLDVAAPLILDENRKRGQVATCDQCGVELSYGVAEVNAAKTVSVGMTKRCQRGYQPINLYMAVVALGS